MCGWKGKCVKEGRDQHYQMLLVKSGKMRTGLTIGISNIAITSHFGKSGFAGVV